MKKRIKTKNSYFIELPLIAEKKRGNLCVGEVQKNIPFKIKRFYCIFGVPSTASRGNHANKNTEQVLFCLNGSIKVELDDGINKDTVFLSKPNIGLFLGKMLWRKIHDFQKDTILLLVASDFYKEKDFIKDYNIFKKIIKNNDFI